MPARAIACWTSRLPMSGLSRRANAGLPLVTARSSEPPSMPDVTVQVCSARGDRAAARVTAVGRPEDRR